MTQSSEPATSTKPSLTSLVDRDLGAGIVLLVVAGVSASQFGHGIRDWAFPRALTYLIGVVGIVLVIEWVVRAARTVRTQDDRRAGSGLVSKQILADIGVVVVAAVVYAVAVSIVGFWLTTFVVLALLSIYLTDRRSIRTVVTSVVVAAVVSAIGYLVFLHVFYVPVPMWLLA